MCQIIAIQVSKNNKKLFACRLYKIGSKLKEFFETTDEFLKNKE